MALASSTRQSPQPAWFGGLPLRQGSPDEDPPEEIHVRLHPKEGLANDYETGNVQHPSRIEVLQLQAPLIEEPVQEPMHGIS